MVRLVVFVSTVFITLIGVIHSQAMQPSTNLGRLVFTDRSKDERKFTVDVFDLDSNKRLSLPLEGYQDIGIKSVIDEQHIYVRLCLGTHFPSACSAYVSEIINPNDVQWFKNIMHFWRENYSSPVWSPDHRYIAFSLLIDSTFKENPSAFSRDIYVMDADGSNMLDLTPNEADNEFGVTWSADSEQVAFGCQDDQKLCIAKIDGSHLQKLDVPEGIRVQQPKWSPDGSQIIFSVVAKDSRTVTKCSSKR